MTEIDSGPADQGHDVRGQGPPEIEFINITTMAREGYPLFSGLMLRIPAGKTTVLMGQRGCGKTLLMRHLLNEVKPGEGHVLINGERLSEMSEERANLLFDGTGILFGQANRHDDKLDSAMTVAQNLSHPVRQEGQNDDEVERRTNRWLREFDLADVAESSPEDLDPRTRRRLAVAQAVIGDPPLAILDDPSSGIDVTHLDAEERAINAWRRRTGSTLIITTHSLELAKALGDNVVVLRDGRVAAEGSPEEVLGGIKDEEAFREHFGSELSIREADPERIRRKLWLGLAPTIWVWSMITLMVLIGVVVIGFYLTGTMDNPLEAPWVD